MTPSITELLARRPTALHEASHALVAAAMGCRVDSVKLIHGDPKTLGQCTYEMRKVGPDGEFAEAVIGIAGMLATSSVWEDHWRYSEADVDAWRSLPRDRRSAAMALAQDLLDRHWDRVQKLADLLLVQDSVTDQALASLLQGIPS